MPHPKGCGALCEKPEVSGPENPWLYHHMQFFRKVCIMGFLSNALFPTGKVSLMLVDGRLFQDMKSELKKYVPDIIEVPSFNGIGQSVSGHPDMQLVHVKENILVCQPDMSKDIVFKLQDREFIIFRGETELKADYPYDIAYNVAIIGHLAFHNTKYTDPVLAGVLEKLSIRLIHVNQGYAKCSVLPITPESIITADPSIAKAALTEGVDVLHIPPQKNIHLEGMEYGFIGGTAGFIDKKLLAIAGNIEMLDNKEEVKMFLSKYNVSWICLNENMIYDYGGLLPLYEL